MTVIVITNIIGIVITLTLLILLRQHRARPVRQEQQAYVQRIRRERQTIVGRLSDIARTEFEDFAMVSVYHWSIWPIQLRAATEHVSFPAVIRFQLPYDYWPSREARDDFADHLHEATAVAQNTGLQWLVRWDIPHYAVWAEIAFAKIDAPYPADWPALDHPRRAGWDVHLVDGKMTGLGVFRNRRGVRAVGIEPDGPGGWWAVIDTVYRELQHRKRAVARGESIADRPSILLVVDEVPTVLALRRGRTADVLGWNEPRREAQRKLTEIAMQGRSLDVHYWPAGQRLAALVVEGAMRENLSALLVFRSTLIGSIQAMESSAAARLPKMPGRAMWTDVESDGEEIQVYGWSAEELDRLLPLETRSVSDHPRVDAYGWEEVTHR